MEEKAIRDEIEQIYDTYKACQSGKKEQLEKLFKVDEFGNVSFEFICLEKLISRAKNTYNKPEKQPKGKHKKFYEKEFDTSDIAEVVYLIVTEIFYAIPDIQQCISVDGYQSKIPIVDGKTLIQNISYFLDKICNERGAIVYKDVSENKEIQNEHGDTEGISLVDWQPPKKLMQTIDGEVALRRECAEILRLFQDDMLAVFSLFNSDSISVKAFIKTILENEQTFYRADDSMEIIEQTALCDLIEKYTGIRIWKNNISAIVATIKARLIEYLYIVTDKHRYIFGKDNVEVWNLCLRYKNWKEFSCGLCKHDDFIHWWKNKFDVTEKQKSLLKGDMDLEDPAQIAETWANEIIKWFESQELEWFVKLSKDYEIRDISEENVKYWNFRYSEKIGQIKLLFYSSENVKHPREVKMAADDVVVYQGYRQYYICDAKKGVAYVLPKNCRKIMKLNCKKVA